MPEGRSAATPIATAEEIGRSEVDGIPVLHLARPGPTIVSLVFNTGRADDPPPAYGLTHAAEHVVMGTVGELALEGQGVTEAHLVSFAHRGTPDAGAAFLAAVARAIREPDFGRLGGELKAMETEAATASARSAIGDLAWARFGHAGMGGTVLPEFFRVAPDRELLRRWIGERLVSGNAAIWVAGELPDEIRCELPQGGRFARPAQATIRGLETPAWTTWGAPAVGASFLVGRSWAASTAFAIASRRLAGRLAVGRRVGYGIISGYERLDLVQALAAAGATCQADEVPEVLASLLGVVDALASDGPTPEELDWACGEAAAAAADPSGIGARLHGAATLVLWGGAYDEASELVAGPRRVTAADVSAVMAAARDSMLLAVPPSTAVPDRDWRPYPGAAGAGRGARTFVAFAWPRPGEQRAKLQVGPAGAAIVDGSGTVARGVRWSDVVATLVDGPGRRRLFAADGYTIGLDAAHWAGGAEAVELLDGYAPAERLVVAPELATAVHRGLNPSARRDPLWPAWRLWRIGHGLAIDESAHGKAATPAADAPGPELAALARSAREAWVLDEREAEAVAAATTRDTVARVLDRRLPAARAILARTEALRHPDGTCDTRASVERRMVSSIEDHAALWSSLARRADSGRLTELARLLLEQAALAALAAGLLAPDEVAAFESQPVGRWPGIAADVSRRRGVRTLLRGRVTPQPASAGRRGMPRVAWVSGRGALRANVAELFARQGSIGLYTFADHAAAIAWIPRLDVDVLVADAADELHPNEAVACLRSERRPVRVVLCADVAALARGGVRRGDFAAVLDPATMVWDELLEAFQPAR